MAYDLRDPDFLRDPAPVLTRMRDEAALVEVRLPLIGRTWMPTTDAAAREILKDNETFVRNLSSVGGKDLARRFWWIPPMVRPLMRNIILMDGAEHKRLRGLVDHAFARASVETLRPEITAIADSLLDAIDPSAPVEIIAAYARELPLLVICALLGVPEADRRKIARWINPISKPTNALSMIAAMPGLWRVLRHFRRDFETVRQTRRPGLILELLDARDEHGAGLSEDEMLAMVFTLFVAGHETTVHLIADAILGLADRPDGRELAAKGGPEAGLMVEEFIRFFSPVMMTKTLYATRDTQIGGVAVAKGAQVSALLIAANHDPARFDNPDTVRLDRRPNAHIGFGFGPHVCLGMHLARSEAQIALTRLFTRFPDLAPVTVPQWSRRLGIHGLTRLDLRLIP